MARNRWLLANDGLGLAAWLGGLLLVAAMGLGTGGALHAQEGACGETVTVQAGDTWESIAQRCGVAMPVLRAENPTLGAQPGAVLNQGDVLAVPQTEMRTGVRPETHPQTAAKSSVSLAKATAIVTSIVRTASQLPFVGVLNTTPYTVDDPNAFVYTVRPGEYWILIARKFGLTFQELRDVNADLWQIRGEIIRPGDEMVIPGLTVVDMVPPIQYVVQPGDSWYRIADLFGVTFWSLRLDNLGLWARRDIYIRPGDEMTITLLPGSVVGTPGPGARTAATTASEPSPHVLPSTPSDSPIRVTDPPEGAEIYSVHPGDTWFSIANQYGITFEQLRTANRLLWERRGQDIRPGDEMIIPPHGSPPPPPEIREGSGEKEPPPAEKKETGDAGAGQNGSRPVSSTYTVQEGDTWASVAAAAGIGVEELKAANIELSNRALQPGDVLRIP